MLLLWIAVVCLVIYAALLLYYKRSWDSLPDWEPGTQEKQAKVSVVIAARNEENNVGPLLRSLGAQTYPAGSHEIILVDDFSTDATRARAQSAAMANLRIMEPGGDSAASSKKKALACAIEAAKGELIVATDADCILPPAWLHTINDCYQRSGALFIAAPVKFSCNGSLLQVFQSLDFMVLQGITAASVGANFHTMCNGANLAYSRQAFYEAGGFAGIDAVASGDDMLLMHKIWKRHPQQVFYLKSKAAIVRTQPMPTLKDFVRQRIRWSSKTAYYKDRRVLAVLLFIYAFNVLFVVLLVAAFVTPQYVWVLVGCWVIKTAIEYPFVASVARFYNEEKLLRFFFFFQPLHILYTVSVGFLSQLGKYTWKGRLTK